MSDLTSMRELNANLKRVIYNEIDAYAKQSKGRVTYFELPDNLNIKLRYDGMTTVSFSVSALLEVTDV